MADHGKNRKRSYHARKRQRKNKIHKESEKFVTKKVVNAWRKYWRGETLKPLITTYRDGDYLRVRIKAQEIAKCST